MNRFLKLLYVIIIFSNNTVLFAQPVNTNDSLALVDLYNSTNGPAWGWGNWLQGPVSTWAHITLDQSKTRVTQVYLYNNNLDGTIPASLGNLTNCTYLDLSYNNLRGTIPASLGNLISVQRLFLDFNQLTGSIPASLGELPNLYWLTLNRNKLSEKVPETFATTQKLTSLSLDYNKFTFDGMEKIAQRNLPYFRYDRQDTTLPLHRRNDTLFVSAGGTLANNSYKWYFSAGYVDTIIKGDSFIVPKKEGYYQVRVDNSVATGETLSSVIKYNGVITFLDPNFALPSLINTDGSIGTNIIGYINPVTSAATDGVTKVLVSIGSVVPVTYTLAAGSGGVLSSLSDQNTLAKKITITPDGYGHAVAIYTVPDGYGKDNLENKIADIIATAGSDIIGHNKLSLVKPPVVMVHGMWSNPEVWEKGGFTKALDIAKFNNVFFADYSYSNASTFNPNSPASLPGRNAIAVATAEALSAYRKTGAAATQVDVIGHSLGGLMTRSWSQQPGFLTVNNFQKGYVHKLITLGTPHRGSPLGPELVASQYNLIRLPFTNDTLPLVTLGFLLTLADMPVGSCHADFGVSSPGINALTATLPYHSYSIAGDQTGQLFGFGAFYVASLAAFNHNYVDIFRATAPCNNVLEHDLVVPVSSQRGYIPKSQLFFSTGHSFPAFNTETNSPQIQSKVIGLLLSDSAAEFSNGFPAPSGFPLDCTTANQKSFIAKSQNIKRLEGTPTDTGFIRIISPANGEVFQQHAGAIIKLQYKSTGNAKPSNCVFMVQGLGWFTITDSVANSTTFTLPYNSSIGNLNIVLIGKDSNGTILGDTIHIRIKADGYLDSIAIESGNIKLDSFAREYQVRLNGYYITGSSDTVKNYISAASAGTTYQVKAGGVFTVHKDGLVSATKGGSDTLIAINGSKTTKTRITVDGNFNLATKYPNAIDFSIPDVVAGDAPFALKALDSSGAGIVYKLLNGSATLSNGIISNYSTAGTITVEASSVGNVFFAAPSPVTRSFNVLKSTITYVFTGNGNWSNTANWQNNLKPPLILPSGSSIIIDPAGTGECVLDQIQHIPSGSSIEVKAGKKIKVLGGLIINQ